jgi:hypothetical protein
MRRAALFSVAVVLNACSVGDPAEPSQAPVVIAPPPNANAMGAQGIASNVTDLFETRILPTCSLNGGVCHNSATYPDLRHLAALEDLVDLPCGRNVDTSFPDACEPPGDRVIAPGVDVGVTRVTFDEKSSTATLFTDADVSAATLTGARIKRTLPNGASFFPSQADGVDMTRASERVLTVALAQSQGATLAFFVPALPLREDRIWMSDVNGNGISGATMGWREIVPGHPERSYLVDRLWDTKESPELMPRQCRAWNDAATRALGCWIQGLRTDESGKVLNFLDDIDYARCTFVVPSAGRCGSGTEALK